MPWLLTVIPEPAHWRWFCPLGVPESMATPQQSEKDASRLSVTEPEPHQFQEVGQKELKQEENGNQDNKGLEPTVSRRSSVEYSIFSKAQKRYIIFTASWAGFFSPLSSQIYFPALNTLANDLHVSNSLINLTLTSYMVWPVTFFAKST